ncbi:hypothetical protein [Anaeromonas gelatinilytica]|uniref:hypothetical protein n=1 Tax=Anaeromonas gelatinilytica TaxID=2683194 RepID=UPI002078E274|nr:hypothetical protein [Anaeromonas gelatinilytica]
MQQFSAKNFLGKRVCFSGFVKTQDITGKGQVWLDNVNFQEVNYNTPTTEFIPNEVFPDYPKNLSFEE